MPSYSGQPLSGDFDLWNLEISQPVAASAYRTGVLDAAYFGKQVLDNTMGAIAASVSSPFYRQAFACASGRATGDPVYLTGANSVELAAASGSGSSKVVGFIREITAADTGCYLAHYWYKTGLTVAVNDTVYLSNAGGVSSGVGTFPHTLGIAISTTGAILQAGPLDGSLSPSPMGGDPATVGSGEDSGSATAAARADHKHALQFSGNPTGVGTGTADSGTLAVAARVDHVHYMRVGYDDVVVPILLVKSGGSSDPTLETIGSGTSNVKLYRFATGNEVQVSFELPHSYKEGTDIECHLHYMGSGSTGGTVVWQLDTQAVAMTGVWTFSGTGELSFTGSGTLNTGGKAQYISFGSITGTSLGIGSQIGGRLSRQGGTTTTAVYAITIGFHYQMDTFGSLTTTSKT